jgi:hypothetical protein
MSPPASSQTPRRWWQRWWARAVGVVAGIGLLISIVSGALSIAKDLGWYTPPTPSANPIATPGPTSTTPPEASAYGGGAGPERTLYTTQAPAGYAVLNSITNNPVQGYEPNFVQIRHLEENNSSYDDRLNASEGDVLVVFAYVANNAADNLGTAATIRGLNARVVLGATESSPSLGVILGGINVEDVWDGATVITANPVRLEYIPNSATFYTGHGEFDIEGDYGDGDPMTLGQSSLDGNYPIGYDGDIYQGNGYLTFNVRVLAG